MKITFWYIEEFMWMLLFILISDRIIILQIVRANYRENDLKNNGFVLIKLLCGAYLGIIVENLLFYNTIDESFIIL